MKSKNIHHEYDTPDKYIKLKMNTIISLKPIYLTSNIDTHILNKLRNEIEGKCTKYGYVQKGSIEILDYDSLKMEAVRFYGNISISIVYTGNVIRPRKNDIIECKIKRFNQFGINAISGPLDIIVIYNDDEKPDDFKENQILKVRIIDSEMKINDNKINVSAIIHKENSEKIEEDEDLDVDEDEDLDDDDDEDEDEDLGIDDDEDLGTDEDEDEDVDADEDVNEDIDDETDSDIKSNLINSNESDVKIINLSKNENIEEEFDNNDEDLESDSDLS